MKLCFTTKLAFFFLVPCLVLIGGVTGGAAHDRTMGPPVYKLPVDSLYHHGVFQDHSSLAKGGLHRAHQRAIHVAHVQPGQRYRLGLRMKSDQATQLAVSLYDRWPYATGAQSFPLATGGGLRGKKGSHEFQWWFGVAQESIGSLLYIKLEARPTFNQHLSKLRYQIFLVEEPTSPMNRLARGVIYHRGPSNLHLLENRPPDHFHYQDFLADDSGHQPSDMRGWPNEGSERGEAGYILVNGDFSQGLAGWQLSPDNAQGVGVFDGNLRIWSNNASEPAGIIQHINTNVAGRDSLKLSMHILISSQTAPASSGGTSPLTLSVCYEDIQGDVHCGDTAFRHSFAIQLGSTQRQAENIDFVPVNTWSNYTYDLQTLQPKPRRIMSIGLAGSGAPERAAWVKNIRLH